MHRPLASTLATLAALAALALALASVSGCAGPRPLRPLDPDAPPRIVGYLASWGVRTKGTRIADLPASQLTHLFYAFARVTPDGRLAMGDPCLDAGECAPGARQEGEPPDGNFGELRRLKARHPRLRLLVSVGGWGGSARFSDVALTDSSRRVFASSAVEGFIHRFPGLFDGIDVDWEYPTGGGDASNVERPEDPANFRLLLAELRRQLDEAGARDGRRYELTIAASASPSSLARLAPARLAPLLDFVNVMTYDYHAGSPMAHFNAPLFAASDDPTPGASIDSTMRAYLAAGVPREKLLVGVPFYGRAYGGVASDRAGLFARSTATPENWRDADGDWRVLARTKLRDRAWIRSWHEGAQVPWLYHPPTGTWISYDDPRSVAAKADYVRTRGLGGIIVWELGGDDGTLLPVINERLRRR
jgi:chitinase